MAALVDTIGTYAMVPVHYIAETVEEAYRNIIWAGRTIAQECIENKDKIFRVFEKCLSNAPMLILLQLFSWEARVITYAAAAITAFTLALFSDDFTNYKVFRPFPMSFAFDLVQLAIFLSTLPPVMPVPTAIRVGFFTTMNVYFVAYASLILFISTNAEHI